MRGVKSEPLLAPRSGDATPHLNDDVSKHQHIVASSHHAASGAPWIENVYASDIYALGCCIAEVFRDGRQVMNFQDAVTLGIAVANQKKRARCLDSRPPKFKFPSHMTTEDEIDPDLWFLPPEMRLINDTAIVRLLSKMCNPDPSKRPSAVECLRLGAALGLFPDSFYEFYLPLQRILRHPFLQFPDIALIYLSGAVADLTSPNRRTALSEIHRRRSNPLPPKSVPKPRATSQPRCSDPDPQKCPLKQSRKTHRCFARKQKIGAADRINALLVFSVSSVSGCSNRRFADIIELSRGTSKFLYPSRQVP